MGMLNKDFEETARRMTQEITIAIADDHPIVVDGLSRLLHSHSEFRVIASYTLGSKLMDGLNLQLPDILLLDLHFPDTRGNDLIRIIRHKYPELKIIVITSSENVFDLKDMIQNGCSGYLLKSTGLDILIEAIKTVYTGGQYIDATMKEAYVALTLNNNKTAPSGSMLSERELKILLLLSNGKTNNEIASELSLSHRTIENNRLSMYKKLGVKNTAELLKQAMQKGLIPIIP